MRMYQAVLNKRDHYIRTNVFIDKVMSHILTPQYLQIN